MNLDVEIPRALVTVVPLDAGGFPSIYPDIAPMDAVLPYVTFSYVGGQSVTTFCGNLPVNTRLQFNAWAKTRLEANRVIREVGKIVTAPPFRAVAQGEPVAEYEPVTKDRGMRQDYSFWLVAPGNTP